MSNTRLDIQLVGSLSRKEIDELSRLLAPAPFGKLAVAWSELVRSAHPDQMSLFYLPVKIDRKLAGLGILYLVPRLDLSQFIDRRVHAVAGQLARLGVTPLSLRIGFLEVPLTNIPGLVLAPEYESERDAVRAQIMQIARAELDMHALCIKSAPHTMGPATDALGPLRVPFLKTATLSTEFPDFSAYLRGLKKKHRKNARRAHRKLVAFGATIEPLDRVDEYGQDLFRLFQVVSKNAEASGRLPLAIRVHERLFTRLHMLGEGNFYVDVMRYKGEIVSFLLVLCGSNARFIKYYGADGHHSRDADAYFNMQYHQTQRAIAEGCRKLNRGVTNDTNKRRQGCEFHPMEYLINVYHPVLKPLVGLVASRLKQAN